MKLLEGELNEKPALINFKGLKKDQPKNCEFSAKFIHLEEDAKTGYQIILLEWAISITVKDTETELIYFEYEIVLVVIAVNNMDDDVKTAERMLKLNYDKILVNFNEKFHQPLPLPQVNLNEAAIRFVQLLVEKGYYM